MSTLPRLTVRREPWTERDDRTELLARGDVVAACWGAEGGVIGWGVAAELRSPDWSGLWRQWTELRAATDCDGDGPAPRAVATLTFDPTHSQVECALILPALSIVEADDERFVLRVEAEGLPSVGTTLPGPRAEQPAPARLAGAGEERYRAAVAEGLARIAAGEVEKVVIATSDEAQLPSGWSASTVAERLSARYPSCWIYVADGLVGASPELLLRRRGDVLASRVLAGTVDRAAPDADEQLRAALADGGKNRREHEFAVASARVALANVCDDVTASREPYVLELPNVVHLASDVRGTIQAGHDLPALLAALHPTAAVAGTPREAALEAIRQAERFDRGRFAGPVGWIDTAGDGEFVIALRGAQLSPDASRLTAYAGAGIVDGSDPGSEWLEVQAKLRPIREALGGPM